MPAPPTGSLSLDNHAPIQGESITFSYTTTARQVKALNWIGLYTDPGNGPIHQQYVGPSTIWERAPRLHGKVSFSTGSLTPGHYIAFFLYDDGYTWLARPVTFTVTSLPPVDPPTYLGAFGGPGGGTGQLAMPGGLGIGADGSIWVADTGNNRVQAFTPRGKPSRIIGADSLNQPADVAVDGDGHVFVADSGHQRIAQFTTAGEFVRDYGKGTLDNPRGVALDGHGRVFASDTINERVRAYDIDSGAVDITYTHQMSSPQGMTIAPDGTLWVAQNSSYSEYSAAVIGYHPDGSVLAILGQNADSTFGGLSNPAYVVLDDVTLYVTLGDYGWTSMFRTTGPFLGTFGSQHPSTMRFPSGIAKAGKDLYIADAWRSQVLHYGAVS